MNSLQVYIYQQLSKSLTPLAKRMLQESSQDEVKHALLQNASDLQVKIDLSKVWHYKQYCNTGNPVHAKRALEQ